MKFKDKDSALKFLTDIVGNNSVSFWDVKTINNAMAWVEGDEHVELREAVLLHLCPPNLRSPQDSSAVKE